ncbi:carbohydrate-binding module family 18 protein [Lentithecium fluviatile CBS 122367]|uniref:Carbohydrate-binding module family 18 protein n=1 Tax=Lentithecium fluviatile CBS 122367 TaxID=1168545 RepID=A0A6G1JGE9_9PLEO|nr:carbohydrate-binding module family 18 protein [Lentithecium fluviatile CBS 122367]
MRHATVAIASLTSIGLTQNCWPKYRGQACETKKCCSQYGWCDIGAAYCDPSTCQKTFSGNDSPPDPTPTMVSAKPVTTAIFPSEIPEIDVCGSAKGGMSCPDAGPKGYFYRCCSSAGHCGPKNDIQGNRYSCDSMVPPRQPMEMLGTAFDGETCGPIVNRKCAALTDDFCGAQNWCQSS